MRRALFVGGERFEVGDALMPGDLATSVRGEKLDAEAAILVLRRAFARDAPELSGALRSALDAHAPDLGIARLSNADVLAAFERLLASHRLAIVARPSEALRAPHDEEREPSTERTPQLATAPELHWVAFELVDDAGEPLGGQPFRAELADGRVVEGRLSSSGRVRWDDLTSTGPNTIRFPRIDEHLALSSSDEDPRAQPPRGASMWSDTEGVRYAPKERTAAVPTDEAHRYRLPGWTPIRMLADDEEAPDPPIVDEPREVEEEAPAVLDEGWDPIAVYLDIELDDGELIQLS
jgi:hypothetical protein